MEIDINFIETDGSKFKQLATDAKNLSADAEVLMTQEWFKDIAVYADEYDRQAQHLALMKYLIEKVMFFPNDGIIMKLKQIGLGKKALLRWLIPINDIILEFLKINRGGALYIELYASVLLIQAFLESKIIVELQKAYGYEMIEEYDGRKKLTVVSKQLLLFFERSKERGLRTENIKFWESPLVEIMDNLKNNENSALAKKFLVDFYEGKTEKYFIGHILNCCVHKFHTELSNRKRNLLLFDFVYLLCKDSEILTEKGYDEKIGGSYDEYKIAVVQNFFGKW